MNIRKNKEKLQNISKSFWRRKKRQKEARDRYQNLSEEEKEKQHQCHHERNKNLSVEEKEKVDYMRNYYLTINIFIFCYILARGGLMFNRGNVLKKRRLD